MPLPDFLNKFNPSLLNSETFEDFKAALLREYQSDVTVLEGKTATAEAKYGDYEKEIKDLKAANWDMWKSLPGDSQTQKTSQSEPDDSGADGEETEAPSLDSFFAPAKS